MSSERPIILVTGGAGFIGSNLVASLAASPVNRVVVCDEFGRGDKWRNLRRSALAGVVKPADLSEFLEAEARDIEAIVHLGAISSTVHDDADAVLATNFALSLRLWQWCTRRQRRFIYASSAATYGDGSEGFADLCEWEALRRLRPLNLYGWSKHLVDLEVARLASTGGPCPRQWVGLKLFNVYGPNEYHKGAQQSVVVGIHRSLRAGEAVRLFRSGRPGVADGDQRRDFVWVDDCVDVIRWCLGHPDISGLFNVGTGRARTFRDLVAAVCQALGRDFPPLEYVDMPEATRGAYQYFTQADLTRLRAAGYVAPFRSLEDGVSQYVGSYLEREDRYR
jgi:ADP-L-glycero-D-manno-heptose 6-epimerase